MVTICALALHSIPDSDTYCMIPAEHALFWHLTLFSVFSTCRQEKKREFM
jgi:hypothetical protein